MNTQQGLLLDCEAVPGHVITKELGTFSKRGAHQEILEALVNLEPGLTSAEYSRKVECKNFGQSYYERRVEAARRLPELLPERLPAGEPFRLRQGHSKKCSVTKRSCVTWWPFSIKKSLVGGVSA